ncbi:MAG: carbamoyltransferase HypF [Cystobacterineae bacterium]|nr:carbamoyltransferase HypF [Cystobacterineae bacterium]
MPKPLGHGPPTKGEKRQVGKKGQRLRLCLKGLVQGVGFRPHVYTLAQHLRLHGFVHNTPEGLIIEVEGPKPKLLRFLKALNAPIPLKVQTNPKVKEKKKPKTQSPLQQEQEKNWPPPLPPLARVDNITIETLPPLEEENLPEDNASQQSPRKKGFSILQSSTVHSSAVQNSTVQSSTVQNSTVQSSTQEVPPLLSVGPDMAVCHACLKELFSPPQKGKPRADTRRYLYAFLNCTHCGPRYSISLRMPWDRPNTTLAHFAMCKECTAEYTHPADRRFHAQPMACPSCGPALEGSLHSFVACIEAGGIVALKAAGGFQLACNAHDEAAIKRLRLRKMREAKPLAVMVPNLATAHRYALLNKAEEALLQSLSRPIVLVRARENNGLPQAIAQGLSHLGLCLPSTPLHYALFYEATKRGQQEAAQPIRKAQGHTPSPLAWLEEALPLAWVMTSANLSGEPLIIDNGEALSKLSGVADCFALHNRPIVIRMDDSLMHMVGESPQMLRRARGFVPQPLPLPWKGPPLLAVGAHLKATFCLLHNNHAYVSQHLGDLDSPEARDSFCHNIEHLCTQLHLKPELLAADLHPTFFSTQWAQETGLPCLSIQHHLAHLAATWAEYPQLPGPLLGLALDGTGLGTDGLPWGGELLWLERGGPHGYAFERLGHLKPLPLFGGDAAATQPWRMGAAALVALGEEDKALAAGAAHGLSPALLKAWKHAKHLAPLSSSLGRQLDAAANLLGLCEVARYEAEAPMLLEALAHQALWQLQTRGEGTREEQSLSGVPWPLKGFQLEADNTLSLLGLLSQLGPPAGLRALWLHEALAKGLAEWAFATALQRGIRHIALGGGCLQNRLLCEALVYRLKQKGLHPLLPQQLPPNDGGLCLGQALLASWHF